jgi:hypothetical protein
MAMLCRKVATGLLVALAVAAWTTTASAGDTVLLKGGVSAPTVTLGLTEDDAADTVLVSRGGFRGGFHGGGFHGGGFHGGGFHTGGFHSVGFRGGWGGYRGFYGRGWGNYARGWGYYGRGWGGYYGRGWYGGPYFGYASYYNSYPYYNYYPYYSAPVYYPPYDCPISLSIDSPSYGPSGGTVIPPVVAPEPTPLPRPADRTYPYDGGPSNLVPMPKADPTPAPSAAPKAVVPLPGERAVSLPAREPAKYHFAAYGEESGRIAPSLATPYTDTVVTKGEPKKAAR